jgi:predicted dehydrogenase
MSAGPARFIHLGTAGWGRRWSDTFLPRLVALGKAVPAAAVATRPESLLKAQVGYGIPAERCYTDAERAFAENPADFAVIVVPPEHHERMVDLAIAHGCHILSEKPIADTMAASTRIALKVRRAGLKMAITMSHRFDQDKQTLERLVRSGEYGGLSHVVGRLVLNNRHRGDWGVFRHQIADPLLLEAAVHQFDCIRALSGSNARRVFATSWNPPWGEYGGDSTALAVVEMENGVRASFEGSVTSAASINPWDQEYWRAELDGGTLELDRRRLRLLRSDPEGPVEATELPLDERPVWMNTWLAEWFVDWLDGGEAPPTTIEDNLHCQALTMAAIQSAHTGEAVDVPAFLARHLEDAEEALGGRPTARA